MAKKIVKPATVRCSCSVCGQVANVVANTAHFFCQGLPLEFFQNAPQLKGRIHGAKKGTWIAV